MSSLRGVDGYKRHIYCLMDTLFVYFLSTVSYAPMFYTLTHWTLPFLASKNVYEWALL